MDLWTAGRHFSKRTLSIRVARRRHDLIPGSTNLAARIALPHIHWMTRLPPTQGLMRSSCALLCSNTSAVSTTKLSMQRAASSQIPVPNRRKRNPRR